MNTELRKPDVGRFNNADHLSFHVTLNEIYMKHETVISEVGLILAHKSKVKQEDQIFKWLRRSEFTEKKAEVDHERDRVFTAFVANVHLDERHYDPTIRNHAKHVANLVDNYGDVARIDYDGATMSIDSIIEKLQDADYLPAVQALQLTGWLTELKRLNDLFKTYVLDTKEELAEKPEMSPKDARKETDTAMRELNEFLEADILFQGTLKYAAFTKDFNVQVDHYNTLLKEHLGRLHARHDIHGSIVETIADQYYTGKPINLIPSVQYRKKETDGTETLVDLVFTVDFTVRYEDNIGPGTAVLHITGIGKYEGEITTTFNIARI
jgi:hypothetical protein